MAHKASFAAIIVAAGKGLRAGQSIPKQFALWRGKPVLRHSAERLANAGAAPLVVAIPAGYEDEARQALDGIPAVHLVSGGESRQDSVYIALESLEAHSPDYVLIHDAARPNLPQSVIIRLMDVLEKEAGAIPVLPVVDSLVVACDGFMTGSTEREKLRRVQTPQAFRFEAILSAHRAWHGDRTAGDDAQVLRASGGDVALVMGDEKLHKLTFAEDFMEQMPAIRTGMGFDVHRLALGEELWLCGVKIDHDHGLSGHSDADVGLHALVDALLGAVAAGDIGDHFPPSDPQWKGARSSRFVEYAVSLVTKAGYRIGNVDLTLMCEAPKIGPHRDAMRRKLAELLSVDIEQVSVKATTTERLGFTGRREGIASQAIATVIRNGE
ncbi:bifunctional 2-C-methyl-D-erythritol 4-phosphate cytidylyltransferase/2-C-methyl-D-erythritol 2,4-cyclodiphosphate synthase [Altererythrobacter indicus]|uniref:Bifunctional enzyme IspD/IspF n=1 Tax=Altericroceibacterium indicum TaxID=374177 RepID=A0A845ADA0_9SPHN|nr:bifunctional 2-C-methyl-D-erythritol 4-phosphate cytidylyltransferase/2-C-methyl-D-erythritol 2,4-cyclodiphosphate synthase [Altericroceibacterium indicum]MXP25168.1 bifunctional 2-C-methyl-D-erythritol 4-phosphate cytidylyltransferase/2-C-methyl-D-erythritol 2,4-cyclodiphosphate synthase [Altericroceibacterium indicum]